MSGESLSYFFPVFTKRHHGQEQQIGSGIEQYFVGQRAVLTAMVKMPAATPACTPKGAFSTTKAFPRLYTGFFQPMR